MGVRRTHRYDLTMTWTGNRGTGTSGYRDYGRDHEVGADGRPAIEGSADRVFHGDKTRWNPELELVAALAQCHMLSYLHVCATAGVVVTAYDDTPYGVMAETGDGGGRFTEVVLRPSVTVASAGMAERAATLHEEAGEKCFIASSVNFPVRHEPSVTVAGASQRARWHATLRWQREVAAALAPTGLTHVQFVLLSCAWWLNGHGVVPNQLQLARQAGTDVKMTSQVVRKLEAKSLIERETDRDDTRAKRLHITEAGIALALDAIERVEQADAAFFRPLTSTGASATEITALLRRLAG